MSVLALLRASWRSLSFARLSFLEGLLNLSSFLWLTFDKAFGLNFRPRVPFSPGNSLLFFPITGLKASRSLPNLLTLRSLTFASELWLSIVLRLGLPKLGSFRRIRSALSLSTNALNFAIFFTGIKTTPIQY